MNQYLLLRDNKQTGPYTAEALKAKGLKAYDLVWQEGKSAAWRYPGEIAELKAFAPIVEEQPYDRFYKKPAEQSNSVAATQNTTATQEQQHANEAVEKAAGKHIHVTMPVTAQAATKPVAKTEQQQTATSTASNTTQHKAASSYLISEEDDELNSSLLAGHKARKAEDDQINNGFLSDYESRKAAFDTQKTTPVTTQQQAAAATTTTTQKQSAYTAPRKKQEGFDLKALLAGSGRYLQDNKNLTRVLVACVLILGGVIIGLIINSGHRQPDNQMLESLVKEIREQKNDKSAPAASPENRQAEHPQQPATTENNEATDAITDQVSTSPNNSNRNNNLPDPQQQAVVRHAVLKKETNTSNAPIASKTVALPASNTSNTPVEATPAVMEQPAREKPVNQEMLEKARRNINDLVHVEASAFKVGLLGGISDLDLTLANNSLYTLDQVAVEVKYFGMEKKLVKSQTILFSNVPAGKKRTLEVPRTNRGITIDYTIVSINSKALGLAQNGY